jgi:hypothetical protein
MSRMKSPKSLSKIKHTPEWANYWEDQNGHVWELCEMEENHINNCIKYLERSVHHDTHFARVMIEAFHNELSGRLGINVNAFRIESTGT